MNKIEEYKSGENVYVYGIQYLFLGYCDAKKRRCIVADIWGNKSEQWITSITKNK